MGQCSRLLTADPVGIQRPGRHRRQGEHQRLPGRPWGWCGAARDESNARTRRRQACFPVSKTRDEFDLTASSMPRATFDYLSSLEWVRAAENLCLIGPAGTE